MVMSMNSHSFFNTYCKTKFHTWNTLMVELKGSSWKQTMSSSMVLDFFFPFLGYSLEEPLTAGKQKYRGLINVFHIGSRTLFCYIKPLCISHAHVFHIHYDLSKKKKFFRIHYAFFLVLHLVFCMKLILFLFVNNLS